MNALNRCFTILTLATTAIAVTGCGRSQYSSPEQTLSTAKTAAQRHDYLALAKCLSPEARDHTAATLVSFGNLMKAAANIPGPAGERAKIRNDKLESVYKKHGITPETQPQFAFLLAMPPAERAKDMLKLVEPIKDREGFIADFFAVMKETADRPDEKLFTDDAHVDDLTITGDTATATFVQTRNGQTKPSPIGFKRLNGNWKIDKVPQLLN